MAECAVAPEPMPKDREQKLIESAPEVNVGGKADKIQKAKTKTTLKQKPEDKEKTAEKTFMVHWNDFQPRLSNNFQNVPPDVIIICENKSFKSHSFLLTLYSSVFRQLLETQMQDEANKDNEYSIINFKNNVPVRHMFLILRFMYYGVVEVPREMNPEFLKSVELLEILGFPKEANHGKPLRRKLETSLGKRLQRKLMKLKAPPPPNPTLKPTAAKLAKTDSTKVPV